MTQPRYKQVSLEATPYYHCVSRCVRRAFLCGNDPLTGKSFEHRRAWIESRILALSQIFMIDVVSYAVMHNHYHVVLHVNHTGANELSNEQVICRWHQLFKGNSVSQRYLCREELTMEEKKLLSSSVVLWRKRLADISWFMRAMNESIAREANLEDNCTGRFWEGRFKSQALLDDKALLACMVYVDLNPVRAGISKSPLTSEYTSIKRRLEYDLKYEVKEACIGSETSKLFSFNDEIAALDKLHLSLSFKEYVQLVQWTSKNIRTNQPVFQEVDFPKVLKEMSFEPSRWLYSSLQFESKFKTLVGCIMEVKLACNILDIKRVAGKAACLRLIDT